MPYSMKNTRDTQKVQWILQEKYDGKMTAAAKKDIKRLNDGEPLDYIIGWMEFLDCKIDLSKRPLIPRPETEFWTEQAIEELRLKYRDRDNQDIPILDMFAGSGCIGVSIMRHIKNAKVVFAEKDENCLKQMNINCKINKIKKNRYSILKSDIFSNVFAKFDYIFANPPYISAIQKKKIQKSVIDYEPHVALFGGEDGMLFIRRFLAEAKNRLNPGGKIYMEFDTKQKPAIQKLLKKFSYKKFEFCKDQYERIRYVAIHN